MNPNDTIALFAELSVALAGFAGVASAFSGRDRKFGPMERGRLLAIVGLSASILCGCLAFLSVSLGQGSVEQATRAAGLGSLVGCFGMVFGVIVPVLRRMKEPEANADPWVVYLSAVLVGLAAFSYTWLILFPGNLWLLGVGFSVQMLHCLWMFLRFLTKPS
jgi:hypothetical protein